ncbi:MAG: FkbM family methyltransferase [Dysgonamonadaceae bacterium]|jgi:FkbM family methyltransferase|nr:FkbM family methyltransferase [Dysgonamonadaceae bacterium]
MISLIKKLIFKYFKIEDYLRILQWLYFFSYKTGLLLPNKRYTYHYYVKKLINKGDTIIDIGANLGYYSILFAKWTGTAGKVFSVEPIAIYNKIFNEKAKRYNNIKLYPYALGDEEKKVELVYSSPEGFLSTGLPHIYNPQVDGNIEKQEFTFEAQMKIPSVLFGDLERIDYIKCDVEGFEYIILSNMKEIIRKSKPKVQVEVWGENEENILRLFEELGYLPYKLSRNQLVIQEKDKSSVAGDYIFLPNKKCFT